MQLNYMAVYGTLKRGYGNNYLCKYAGMPFISTGKTTESDFFLQGGGFPICRDGGSHSVSVEVFAFKHFEQIEDIDRLEGHPEWYKRRKVPITLSNGEIVDAWMYIQEPLEEALRVNMIDCDSVTVTEGVAQWT
jgi:gamma-glutamylcyclotransferase (GGCT)/AIG2-like uncharacterized protein YtfP